MATSWYWREGEQEKGPVTFRELSLMVREQTLTEDDYVRPDYSNDWQKTYQVVGLFYMAGRVAEVRLETSPDVVQQTSPVKVGKADSAEPLEQSREAFGTRLQVHTQKTWGAETNCDSEDIDDIHNDVDFDGDTNDSDPASSSDGSVAAAIEAATDAWDRRHPASVETTEASPLLRESFLTLLMRPTRRIVELVVNGASFAVGLLFRMGQLAGLGTVCSWIDRVVSRQVLTLCFRAGFVLFAVALTTWGVMTWSDYETMKYPNPDWIASGKRVFPMFGACTPTEFYFLLFDFLGGATVLAYFGARFAEQMADR